MKAYGRILIVRDDRARVRYFNGIPGNLDPLDLSGAPSAPAVADSSPLEGGKKGTKNA